MAEHYASKADFDNLRQQIHSDPSKAFPAFRCMPQVIHRDYSGAAGPAWDTWDTFFSYQGGGGQLYPDRQAEFRIVAEASNQHSDALWYLTRIRINGEVVHSTQSIIIAGQAISLRPEFRLIALGSNGAQLLDVSGTVYGLAENLANPWAITYEVTWRDAIPTVDFYELYPADVLTQPVDGAYFIRYHALGVLT